MTQTQMQPQQIVQRPQQSIQSITDETIASLDSAVQQGLLALGEASQFKRTFGTAIAMSKIRSILTPQLMQFIMPLQNTSIGFKTDKAGAGYPEATVKECLIAAVMNGVYPVGNEFNIISGQCYITKEGFGHKLRDLKGLKYKITPSVATKQQNAPVALITMHIEWKYNGDAGKEDLPLSIRVFDGQGQDLVVGKATRKARAWLYNTLTGCDLGDGDADEMPRIRDVTPPGESVFEKKAETVEEDGEPVLKKM